jgi:hypothetical protein
MRQGVRRADIDEVSGQAPTHTIPDDWRRGLQIGSPAWRQSILGARRAVPRSMRRARGTGQGRRQVRRRPESVATDRQLSLACACAALCPQPIVPRAFPGRLRLRPGLRSWCFPDLLLKTQNRAVLFPSRGRKGSRAWHGAAYILPPSRPGRRARASCDRPAPPSRVCCGPFLPSAFRTNIGSRPACG